MSFLDLATVRFTITSLPPTTPEGAEFWLTSHLTGWAAAPGGWRFERLDGAWVLDARVPVGTLLDAKVTRGTDDSGEGDEYGHRAPGHRVVVTGDASVEIVVRGWQDRPAGVKPSTSTGRVEDLSVFSPELGLERDVRVWLPPGYDREDRAYPVLVLHDGQNVFDAALAFQGVEWGADEAADTLARGGLPVILVAVPVGAERAALYTPFPSRYNGYGPRVEAYTDFLAGTLLREVGRRYRVLEGPTHTGVAGSSFGGLASLYAGLTRPDVFGFVGAFSPSTWLADFELRTFVEASSAPASRFYLDMGGREGGDVESAALLVRQTRVVAHLLSTRTRETRLVIDPGGWHDEAAWARRFPEVLRWFAEASRGELQQA
ncbi:alpha/beta hydrolase [Deinococcus pimensis]|uniref:alpha/beta hydrolase n=1 Tax=Deinococcus pimensis TaxID=309888 RepID=UPI0004B5C22C|nr:alpha/beta hydrolase-fold protein [Deinococcus pimensis]